MRFLATFLGVIILVTSLKSCKDGDKQRTTYSQCSDSVTVIRNSQEVVPASFPGGEAALQSFITSNKNGQIEKAKGIGLYSLNVDLIIGENGKVDSVTVVDEYGYCNSCVIEARRLISMMPDWNPAYILNKDGTKTFVKYDRIIEMDF